MDLEIVEGVIVKGSPNLKEFGNRLLFCKSISKGGEVQGDVKLKYN